MSLNNKITYWIICIIKFSIWGLAASILSRIVTVNCKSSSSSIINNKKKSKLPNFKTSIIPENLSPFSNLSENS